MMIAMVTLFVLDQEPSLHKCIGNKKTITWQVVA